MELGSKRIIIAILAGLIVCFLFVHFTRITWLAPILGICITGYIGKVSTPKEGALLGAFVPVPAGIYTTLPVFMHSYSQMQETGGTWMVIIAGIVGVVFFLLVGVFYGFVLGKIFQFLQKQETIIF